MPENANIVQISPSLIKMAGYLEKRGKMGMIGTRWRRWWCVLEGRLLLYYKSHSEYSNLSPCRGSLNMGLAASVTPARNFQLHVATRSQICVLKARNQAEQERWLQALLDSMSSQSPHPASVSLSDNSSTVNLEKPVQHFRYSSHTKEDNQCSKEVGRRIKSNVSTEQSHLMIDNRPANIEEKQFKNEKMKRLSYQDPPKKNLLTNIYDRYSNSQNFVCGVVELDENFNLNHVNEKEKSETFDFGYLDWNKRKRISDFGNENSLSDVLNLKNNSSSIQEDKKNCIDNRTDRLTNQLVNIENSKLFEKKLSRHYYSVPGENKKVDNLDKEKLKSRNNAYKEKRVSLHDCRLKIKSDTNLYDDPVGSVERLFTCINKDTRITRRKSNEIKENILKMRSISDACLLKSIYDDTSTLPFEKELKKSVSKTELTAPSADASGKSKSCENVYVSFKLVDSNQSSDSSLDNPPKSCHSTNSRSQDDKNSIVTSSTPKRTDSFLKRFITPSPKGVEKVDSMKKRSFSFFHKLVSKSKNKQDSSKNTFDAQGTTQKQVSLSRYQQSAESDDSFNSFAVERQIFPDYSNFNSRFIIAPDPEPRPDYDEYSSGSDRDELNDSAPELPPRHLIRPKSPWHDVPTNNQPVNAAIPPPLPLKLKQSAQSSNPNYINFVLPARQNTSDSSTDDLTKLTTDLDDIISTNKKENSEETIYDVPRPHAALSLTLQEASLNCDSDDVLSSDFREHMIGEPDSLDISTKPIFLTETESCITPDSLEINWCLKSDDRHQYEYLHESWINGSLPRNMFYLGGEQFHDSLDFSEQSQNHLLQY